MATEKSTTSGEKDGNHLPDKKRQQQSTEPLLSRDIIRKEFERTADLTTIEVDETILSEDPDKGAKLFAERFADLLSGKAEKRATLFWLVSDSRQLREVLEKVKDSDESAKSVYAKLNEKSVVAVADKDGKAHQLLKEAFSKAKETGVLAVTATPSEKKGTYLYYGHRKPTPAEGWLKGPRCLELKDLSESPDALITALHDAQRKMIEGVTKLELTEWGVSVKKIESLII